jgi:hypothetical protein
MPLTYASSEENKKNADVQEVGDQPRAGGWGMGLDMRDAE